MAVSQFFGVSDRVDKFLEECNVSVEGKGFHFSSLRNRKCFIAVRRKTGTLKSTN